MGVIVREKVKGSGEWWVFLVHNGVRKSKLVGDEESAEAVARELRKKIAGGDFGILKKKAQSFGSYAKRWRENVLPATCKPSTVDDYESILDRHVLPVFKSQPIDKINRLSVKEFLLQKVNEGFSVSTVTHLKNIVSGVCNLAVDDQVITVNPAQKLGKIMKQQDRRLKGDPLTREELVLLLNTFQQHYPRHYPMALTLARTGMRLGEVLALKWGDIDFHGRFVHVERGFSRGKIETPKSGKRRKVDMSKQLSEVLSNLKHQRKIETLERGWESFPEWVFVGIDGKPLNKDTFNKSIFNKALDKAKLRHVRVHDLRHTFASLLIQAGESLAYVKDQLGHHSIKVTVDIYGHLAPEGNKSAVDRLDDAPFCTLSAPVKKKGLASSAKPLKFYGDDEARTRDLRRDRPAL